MYRFIAFGWAGLAAIAIATLAPSPRATADSALPLIGGFDAERIQLVYPPADPESIGQLSKLIFRLQSVDSELLEDRTATAAEALGDAIAVDGTITQIRILKVPAELIEFLEIERLEVIDLESDGEAVRVITTDLATSATPGDRVTGFGVLIDSPPPEPDTAKAKPTVIAAAKVAWYPKSPIGAGWKMLSAAGVDVSMLSDVATRNHKPLMAEDGDAFYALLAAAAEIGQGETPEAAEVSALSVMKKPKLHVGHWIRMDLETVQVTRVVVTEAARQKQLGKDHYFQIDAVGDLGKDIVEIDRGDAGPPVRFAVRYPVSIVMRDLPPLLGDAMRQRDGGEAMVVEIGQPITVDAFFFRLWSYSTEYMNQQGGGNQFGPLLVAARIGERTIPKDPAGVGRIGWIAALVVLASIAGIWLWSRRAVASDRAIREKRQQLESEQLQLPQQGE